VLVNTTYGIQFQLAANRSICLDGGTPIERNCALQPYASYPYCNPALDATTRATDLVSRLSLDEKAINLQNNNPGIARLGVEALRFNEALHGIVSGCGAPYQNNSGCPTSFPHALHLGSSFNRTLWSTVGSAISTEGRSLANQGIVGAFFWAPDINLFRDPRLVAHNPLIETQPPSRTATKPAKILYVKSPLCVASSSPFA
jgi:hypothetical protein